MNTRTVVTPANVVYLVPGMLLPAVVQWIEQNQHQSLFYVKECLFALDYSANFVNDALQRYTHLP